MIIRRALVDRLLAATPTCSVVGPGGAGKTTLVQQSAEVAGRTLVTAAVGAGRGTADDVQLAVLTGLRAAGMPAGADDDPADVLASAVDRVLVLVDDVHRVDASGARALADLLARLAGRCPVVVAGRHVPDSLAAIAPVAVGDTDLVLTPDELAALAGPVGDPDVLDAVLAASGGLCGPARLLAEAVAAGRLRPEQVRAPAGAVAAALAEALADLNAEQGAAVPGLFALRLLVDGIDRALGAPGLLSALRDAGLPIRRDDSGHWTVPDWVADRLAARSLGDDAAARASRHYRTIGAVVEAVAVLLDAGSADAAAAVLADLSPGELDALDIVDVDALLARFPAATAAGWPELALLQARLCADAVLIERRTGLLARLAEAELVSAGAREVAVERARDLIRDGHADDADALAASVLAEAGPQELRTRAVAAEVRGRAAAWGAADLATLERARGWFDVAAAAAERFGSAELQSAILGVAGYRVELPAGRLDEAARALARASRLVAARPRRRAVVLTFLAEVEHLRGRFDAATVALDEAAGVAERLGDTRLRAYVAWERGRGAGLQGRVDELVRQIQAVERWASEWFEHPSGMVFLADMADVLDRNGEVAWARRYCSDALARMHGLGFDDPEPLLAALAIEARRGDPAAALGFAERIAATGQVAPLRAWRVALLVALARQRAGDPVAPSAAAAALDEAGRLGLLDLAALLEPDAVRLLAPLARAASVAAATLAAAPPETGVHVLGGFAVTVGGAAVGLPPGQPTQLVKLLAVRRGRLHVEQAIDILWPDADLAGGRKLLRNVLTRLHRGLPGALVVRDGDTLAFAPEVAIDAARFAEAAGAALAAGDPTAAGAALAAYPGELLPDDPYDDWAAAPRVALRRQAAELARVLAADAAGRDDVEARIRHLERLVDVDPDDAEAHVELHRVLTAMGRHGAAEHALARLAARDAP